MAGRKRTKKLAAGLVLLLLGAFIYTTTGARARPNPPVTTNFDGVVLSPIQVTCAPGATTGTGEVKVKVVGGSGFQTGDVVPTVLVTWSLGSVQIDRYDTFFTVSNAPLPCPTVVAPLSLQSVSPLVQATQDEPFVFHFAQNDVTKLAQLVLNLQISINLGS
jgi:hypothetical protein